MLSIRTQNKIKEYAKGFTLIELITVIAIIAILSTIAIPTYTGYVRGVKEKVCSVNRVQLERMYGVYLSYNSMVHSEDLYLDFLKEYGTVRCPSGGTIRYIDGKVWCDEHSEADSESDSESESESDDDGGIPFF